jgi:hypothetical protein
MAPQENQKKPNKQKKLTSMKTNRSKCIWTACIAAVAVCTTMTTAYADNLGQGYISNVTGVNECAVNTQTGNSHK